MRHGLAYRHLGRFDEARTYFQKGLKQNPHDPSCLFNLGYIEEGRGNHAAAEALFQQALRAKPDFPDALLELAKLRITNKRFEEAAVVLRKYVKVSRDPASGYYKLAMVERSLHQTQAAERDLNVFQTLSKSAAPGPYPYQHFFDYVENRADLAPQARTEQDLAELVEQVHQHPDQPANLYLLAETYLKLGQIEDARKTVAQLDEVSAGTPGTRLASAYCSPVTVCMTMPSSISRRLLQVNPASDDVKFDLAGAYFRKGLYPQALDTIKGQISAQGQKDDAVLALLGDTYAHLGERTRAGKRDFRDAISRNPDNDQYYLSLTLIQLRENDLSGAKQTCNKGSGADSKLRKNSVGLRVCLCSRRRDNRGGGTLRTRCGPVAGVAGRLFHTGRFFLSDGTNRQSPRSAQPVQEQPRRRPRCRERVNRLCRKRRRPHHRVLNRCRMAARKQLLQFALSLADRTL